MLQGIVIASSLYVLPFNNTQANFDQYMVMNKSFINGSFKFEVNQQ